jgi:hypothetical protein
MHRLLLSCGTAILKYRYESACDVLPFERWHSSINALLTVIEDAAIATNS